MINVDTYLRSYVNPRRLVPVRMSELYETIGTETTIIGDASYETEVLTLPERATALWHLADGRADIETIAKKYRRMCGDAVPYHRVLGVALSLYRKLEGYGILKLLPGAPSFSHVKPIDVLLLTTPDPIHYVPEASGVAENSSPPLGLLYLASSLEQAGIDVAVYDLNARGADPEEVKALLLASHPRIVGLSVLTSVSEIARVIFRVVRDCLPNVFIVAGGAHPSVAPWHVLSPGVVDAVVRGEGEITFVELVRAVLSGDHWTHLPGVSFSHNGLVQNNPERATVRDLDSIALPARHLVSSENYLQRAPVITSRGCMHDCLFCASVLLRGRGYRARSLSNTLKEIDHLILQGHREFEFQDDDLSGDTVRMVAIAGAMKERKVAWACQSTIRSFSRNAGLVDAVASSGCQQVFFGVESGNDAILRRLKGIDKNAVRSVIRAVSACGIRVVASFIIGWPDDTPDTIDETLQLALELRELGTHTPFSILTPFPGTPLHANPDIHGVRIEVTDYTSYTFSHANISTRSLSRDQLSHLYFNAVKAIARTY